MKTTEEKLTAAQAKIRELRNENKRRKEQNFKLMDKVEEERGKVAAYIELANIHSAYIAVLLKRLNADKEHPVTISMAEVTEAMKNTETRALPLDNADWQLYYADK